VKYQEMISKMTLEEKAAMMSGKSFWKTVNVDRLGIPSIMMTDGPHGLRKQAEATDHLGLNPSVPSTCFPTAATIANSWDTSVGEKIGKCLGVEATSQGVSMVLGPGLNIKRSPLCGRNFEYFSEDPYLSGKMAAGYIKGMQEEGIAACPKHFAANSQELRRLSNDSVLDERTLREIYTTGFEIAVKEGKAKSIMTAYNQVNGVYANENEYLLRDILVDEWGFKGFVVSDWGGSNDHAMGVKNGSHLEMPTTKEDGKREILRAIQAGTLSEDILDERIDELLQVVFDLKENEKEATKIDVDKHHQVARQVAEESIVLLKNEDNILPLNETAKVAIIGDFAEKPRYQGAGSSVVNPTKIDDTCNIAKTKNLEILGYEQGFLRAGGTDVELRERAVALASKAEVVLFYMGLDELSETEGMDREHMKINENQIALLEAIHKVNEHIVVVLSAGASVEMAWIHMAKGLVHGYLAGQAGAEAILNVVTGQVCPSGRLSETYPLAYEDASNYKYYPAKEKTAEYRESIFVGYRYYDTLDMPVRFPFGYGLSYTTFAYLDMTVTNEKVSITIENTGTRDGAEVIQMYVAAKKSEIFRPSKELKGFQKVFLKAGERKTVTIPFDDKTFRYFHVGTRRFEIEGTTYEIMVGSNSRAIHLSESIEIAGTNATAPYDKTQLPSYYKAEVTNVADSEFEVLLGRPIPENKWDTSKELGLNDAVCQMYYAKSPLARLICKIIENKKNKSLEKGAPDLNILFIYNIPFRGIAKMTGGAVSMDMARAMLVIVNGQFFKGVAKLCKAFFANKKKAKVEERHHE